MATPANSTPTPRRAFLRGLAALPLAGGVALVARPAQAASDDIVPLWTGLLAARGRRQAATDACNAAEARLPWWAAPGPQSLDWEGRPCGPVVCFPAIQDVSPPSSGPGIRRQIRLCHDDIAERYRIEVRLIGEKQAREKAERHTAELDARIAAKEAERVKVGLPALEDACDAVSDDVLLREDAILALPPTSADVVAAQVIVATALETIDLDDTRATSSAMHVAAVALAGLMPHLSPEIATDAAEFQVAGRKFGDMRFSKGVWTG